MELGYKKNKMNLMYGKSEVVSSDRNVRNDSDKNPLSLLDSSRSKSQNTTVKKTRDSSNSSLNDKSLLFDPKKYVN
jgi:hypothetical protein